MKKAAITNTHVRQMERQVLRERKLWDALYRITRYEQPERLRKNAERDWGLSSNEAVDMAYENVLQEAKNAIRGTRRPTPSVPNVPKSSDAAGVSSSKSSVSSPLKPKTLEETKDLG